MSEAAQIILAVGLAQAVVLFALNGPLATVLNRGSSLPLAANTSAGLSRREWWLVAIACLSALPSVASLLGRLI